MSFLCVLQKKNPTLKLLKRFTVPSCQDCRRQNLKRI